MNFFRCGNKVSDGPLCNLCKRQFDFACAGITETNFRKLGERRSTWRCIDCKNAQSPASTSYNNPGIAVRLEEMQATLVNITQQLVPLASLIEDVKTIKLEISNLKSSVEFAHQTAGQLSVTVKSLESRISQVEEHTNLIHILGADLKKFKEDLQDKEQWARANNVEIKGIPVKKSENLYDIVDNISKVIQCSIRKEDINYIARVPSLKAESQKSIIMALNNRYCKEEFVAAARKHKELKVSQLGYADEGHVYVNDHLTLFNKALLKKAKDLAKTKNFKYVWIKHCKILARKSDTSPTFRIKSEKDLLKFS
ncbi:unnamed protein product [Parnassius apollo]|uniref:(apollo) hypothetical protein n=1 Tax=Parnassius apollo TaxID=110799 RepID=A0A8S3WJ59_PARAO|nr:unnamed protein product [Parnassius apollo]